MIEHNLDIPFVAAMALREKQIQQNYRPIIAVHKWFARRPGTLFRALLLSEFGEGTLRDIYFKTNTLSDICVADPFMGGGTPLLEANRLGCDVIGYDINPMAYWIVRQEVEQLDLIAYRKTAKTLLAELTKTIGPFYTTRCLQCESPQASVKYFLWIKIQPCRACGKDIDLFPGYLLAENRRHPRNVFICSCCGELTETPDRKEPGTCQACRTPLTRQGPAKRNRCICPSCGVINTYPTPMSGPLTHHMFAIEYHCLRCRPYHKGRFFKKPDLSDLAKYAAIEETWRSMQAAFIPEDAIPRGDETDRLHRWGYHYYRQMFNTRQLLGLELSCRAIAQVADERVRNALATNLSDLLRYQNMLCRYDTMALKSLDIFSVHGFPVGLVQCESNLLGIVSPSKGTSIGSGGWTNIIEKYTKAKLYCARPFEVAYREGKKVQIPIHGEWIGDCRNGTHPSQRRRVVLRCQSATCADLPSASLDAVITDPPYFGNVQYAELMDFCYVWLRRLVGESVNAFTSPSTRNSNELTGNVTMERDLSHFAGGLAEVFCRMAHALKPGSPFIFTYHHNTFDAYYPVAAAILDAGLVCSASFPCPAEMGGSIHINKTGSSIVDTVFVCRSTGKISRRWIADTPEDIAGLARQDLESLRAGTVTPTRGDLRCMIFGHMIRMAIWHLRHTWSRDNSIAEKLSTVKSYIDSKGGLQAVEQYLEADLCQMPQMQQRTGIREPETPYRTHGDDISF